MTSQEKIIRNAVFRERLRLLMSRNNLTQMQLHEITKISQGAISDYLKGKSEPKAAALYRLSRTFSVTMEWLWGEDETDSTPKGGEICDEEKLRQENAVLKDRLKTLGTAIRTVLDKYEC